MKLASFVFLLVTAPCLVFATTAPSLSARIVIDGRVTEYAADEWVLDSATNPHETTDDSRWGSDNDIHRVAITWDTTYLYLAVEARNTSSALMSFVQYGAGGLSSLDVLGELRRRISFDAFAPNIVALAQIGSEPSLVGVDAGHRLASIGADDAPRRFVRFSDRPGAFEMAIPWSSMTSRQDAILFLFAITGEEGTGAGDAAPNPTRPLSPARFEEAALDRVLIVTVDEDGDGSVDMGISPNTVARIDTTRLADSMTDLLLEIEPDTRTFAPDTGESLSFMITSAAEISQPVYLSCRIFSITGELIRVLYEDVPRIPGIAASQDGWDGRNRNGEVVVGGVYVIHISWGAILGVTDGSDKAAIAVVR